MRNPAVRAPPFNACHLGVAATGKGLTEHRWQQLLPAQVARTTCPVQQQDFMQAAALPKLGTNSRPERTSPRTRVMPKVYACRSAFGGDLSHPLPVD
jgi:hypothetical protein